MSSTIYSGAHIGQRVRKPWSKRKKIAVVATAGALALGTGTAWAAYALFGFGHIDSSAAANLALTVNNESAQLTAKLVPGSTVGAKAVVTNSNDFPVKITQVLVRDANLAVTPNIAACQQSVHVVGTAGASWPNGGTATAQTIADPVLIQPGESKWIEVPQAVKQDASASVLCGVSADFAVKGETVS